MNTRKTNNTSDFFSVSLFALTLWLTFTAVLFSGSSLLAETRYVKPSSEVVVRRGQGNDYKIIAMVKDGMSVEFLEEGDSYAKVRLANGKEGWMLKRFLSTDPPLEEIVTLLRSEKEEIEQKANEVAQQLEDISSTLAQTETELITALTEKNQIMTNYQVLQRDTADVIQIKTDLLQTTKDNESLMRELSSLKQENNNLKKNTAIKWFLAGGGVLFIGILRENAQPVSKKKIITLGPSLTSP